MATLRSRIPQLLRCTVAMTVSLTLLAPAAATAQQTRDELDAARQRLSTLEARIVSYETQLDALQSTLTTITGQLGRERNTYSGLQRELSLTRHRLGQARDRHEALSSQVAQRARAVYMYGPSHWLELVLGSSSMSEATSRVTHVASAVRQDTTAVLEVRRSRAALQAQEAQEARLLERQAATLRSVETRQRELARAVAEQQQQAAELARTRAETLSLIDTLRDRLRSEELARASAVAGRGTPMTFGAWGEEFLRTLGAPVSRNNMVVMVTWQAAEYTRARWNPLATSMPMPGATVFNSHGVRNYVSMEQGIEATIRTLRLSRRGYEPVLQGLLSSAEPMTTARAINASMWCRGCAGGNYVTGLIPAVEANYDRYARR